MTYNLENTQKMEICNKVRNRELEFLSQHMENDEQSHEAMNAVAIKNNAYRSTIYHFSLARRPFFEITG